MSHLAGERAESGNGLPEFGGSYPNDLVRFSQSISWEEFETIRGFAFRHAGISIADYKQNMVLGRVVKRLRALKINTIAEYIDFLNGPLGVGEHQSLINALTTNKTSFFREGHHFRHLEENVLRPAAVEPVSATTRRIRIWSAGCSTGEEPYSIAMTAMKALSATSSILRHIDLKILGTDIDTNVVARSKAARYPVEALGDMPEPYARAYMRQMKDDPAFCEVREFVRDKVIFKSLNLLSDWPMKGPFDAVFCRNVVIYFNKDTQRMLFDRFASMLPVGGFLYIGHSESLHRVTDRFQIIGQSMYRRIA